jgi:hypothetical protein
MLYIARLVYITHKLTGCMQIVIVPLSERCGGVHGHKEGFMKLKRLILGALLAVPLTLGVAAPAYADESSDPVEAELAPCPYGYTGVKIIVIVNGQPTGVVVCQNIRP